MPVVPIITLVITVLGITYCALAPFKAVGQTEAIALVFLILLRGNLYKPTETRMGDVIENLIQGLYMTTLFALFKLANAQGIADLVMPIFAGICFAFGSVIFALTRNKPLGGWKYLANVPSLIAVMGALVAYWLLWDKVPLHIAMIWSLLAAIFFTMPESTFALEPVQAPSRSSFAVAELSNRISFAIGLSFLMAGAEQDYVFPLVGVTLLMLFISAYRIWRWQPGVGQPA